MDILSMIIYSDITDINVYVTCKAIPLMDIIHLDAGLFSDVIISFGSCAPFNGWLLFSFSALC